MNIDRININKKVLKVCSNEWDYDSRDKRELQAFKELGCDVCVMAKGKSGDYFTKDIVSGFDVYRFSTRYFNSPMFSKINHLLAGFFWAKAINKMNPDIISGHDMSCVLIAFLYKVLYFKRNIKIIYDSHELETERNTNRSKLAKLIIKLLEKKICKKSNFTIVVNDSIANELVSMYNLNNRPIVVRSTPNLWTIDKNESKKIRDNFLKEFDASVKSIVMFHGNLGNGNGIEIAIKAISALKDIGLVLMGAKTSESYFKTIRELINNEGLESRVLIKPPVDIDVLGNYINAVDIEIMVIEPIVKSHYFVLPNKFFEAIQAEIPIIATNLPEMEKLINKYNIGLSCEPGNITATRDMISLLNENKELYKEFKKNIIEAKHELCWEKEKNILKEAIIKYLL